MKRLFQLVTGALALAFGWYFYQQYGGKLSDLPIPPGLTHLTSTDAPPPRLDATIRVATFNIQVFGEDKMADPAAMGVIVEILRQFDVIAIQEIRAVRQDLMPRLVELINAGGKHQYDYCIGPRLGNSVSKEQYAFVFDRTSIEVDRNQLYTVDDPDNLLHREPLVGWFRCRAAEPDKAFTFSLVNVHTDPDIVDYELDWLDDVFFAVRDDQRREDDVIMLGDFNVNDKNLRQLGSVPSLVKVVAGVPTNTRGNAQYDNILFAGTSTTEFTGRGGVYDFMREFNLTQEQALQVSDHLPVWAEFSVIEGGAGSEIATRPGISQNNNQ
ncbi:Endonuclease/exonuclease/phosphatase [Pirellula staleyi DSM 6068]|uniref:Endonuclease/exonuclease/phosphatase n=1 Tax=Pirellula staleyi (strain ATCC 27377 / DSM 6068 / ICPB 4128) TaxID=530564 RepID=D2R4L4_PIRSD|nr:endonuclease/exonuclease/phosphatase family protein [Pirellula staleyi]ADB17080.1 Endonuclease/exonuclease/phosphatase [Pirellula staleyi DSM 6068]